MGKFKTKKYTSKIEKDSKTIFVYGEMTELPYHTGFAQVLMTPKGRVIKGIGKNIVVSTCDNTRGKVRTFNMGWCICQESDEFNEELAISTCKRRFSKSPLKTQNGMWLNEDMCNVLVDNEVNYIAEHLEKFEKYFSRKKKK
jgi:hypothetical protein